MSNDVIPLSISDLDTMASMCQGIDNQYVPLMGLKKMRRERLSRADFRGSISKSISAEFRRTLLYSERIVVNRAFLTNTKEIYGPLLSLGKEKEALVALFKNGAITPYLYSEKSLLEESGIVKSDEGARALKELIREAGPIPCVRFSWDENENIKYANKIARAFTGYALSMRLISKDLARDLKIRNVKGFEKRLVEVANFCLDTIQETSTNHVTRTQLYEKFILGDSSEPDQKKENIIIGKYDFDKPYSIPLKLILDLKYQSNLTDALKIQTFSAKGLPERGSLNELKMIASGVVAPEIIELPDLFSEVLFGSLREGLWLNSINDLSLDDIFRLRNSAEHKAFIAASRQVKEQARNIISDRQQGSHGKDGPIDFRAFYRTFCDFQEAIAKVITRKRVDQIKPKINLIVKLGLVTFTFFADQPVLRISGAIGTLREDAVDLSAKIFAGAAKDIDLSLNFEFMRTRIADAETQYHKLIEYFTNQGFTIEREADDSSSQATLSTEDTTYPEL